VVADRTTFADRVKLASQDALRSIKGFADDPIGKLAPVYESLGPERAMAVAIAFALAFEVCLLVGVFLTPQRSDWWFPFGWHAGRTRPAEYLKLVILGVVPFAGIAAVSTAARSVFRGSGRYEGDLFIAGAALLPFALLLLASGVLGAGQVQTSALLSVFALSYAVLIIYGGYTQIAGIPSRGAVLAIPIALVVSWLATPPSSARRPRG
jgi:hypothetical protein